MAETTLTHAGLVRAVSREVERSAHATARIAHSYAMRAELHPTDLKALCHIYRAELEGTPMTASGLAERLDLSPAAVTYSVDRLAASGHVWRDRDSADRRRCVLRFAAHGRDVAKELFDPLAKLQARVMAQYGDAQLEAALQVLQLVNGALLEFDQSLRDAT